MAPGVMQVRVTAGVARAWSQHDTPSSIRNAKYRMSECRIPNTYLLCLLAKRRQSRQGSGEQAGAMLRVIPRCQRAGCGAG
jgi:hypothetical protein